MGVATSTSRENNKYLGNQIKVSDLPDLEKRQNEKKLNKDKNKKQPATRSRSLSLALPSSFRTRGRASTLSSSGSFDESDLPIKDIDEKFNFISTHYLLLDQSDSQAPIFILPDLIIKNIICYAVGSSFPSKHFSSISLVCRAWWRMSFQSITHLHYHFPYIYEKDSDIRRCKLMARWLSPTNHYDQLNQIESVSLGFGFDTSGMCLLFPHLLKSTTLRTLRVTFYQRQVPAERIKAISTLLAENTGIRRLDMSHNIVQTQSITQLASVFKTKQGGLRELVWRDSSLQDEHFRSILEGLVSSQVFHLNLAGNAINGSDIEKFSSILMNLRKPSRLASLDLSYNELGFEKVQQVIEACRANKHMKRLKLVGNILTEEELAELRYNLEKLKGKHHLSVTI